MDVCFVHWHNRIGGLFCYTYSAIEFSFFLSFFTCTMEKDRQIAYVTVRVQADSMAGADVKQRTTLGIVKYTSRIK